MKISRKNLPSKLNVNLLMIMYIYCDYYNAPEWGWTLAIVLGSFILIGSIIGIVKEKEVDIFSCTDSDDDSKKKSFSERLNDKLNKK